MKNILCEMTPAGRNIYVRMFDDRPRSSQSKTRAKKERPTVPAMQAQNDHNAARKLAEILDCNFTIKDLLLTLTYTDAPAEAEARKHLEKFVRKLREKFRRADASFKYIAVTEYENKRIHHHIILPGGTFRAGVSFEDIEDAWGRGLVLRKPVYSKSLFRLAGYLVKETAKTMRKDGAIFKRRWSGSRNLVRPPDPDRVLVDEDRLSKPRAPRGYRIEDESFFEGENPYTGRRHIEYILVPDTPAAKYRRRPGAKKGRARPTGETRYLKECGIDPYAGASFGDLFAREKW